MKFEIFVSLGLKTEYRWRLRAANGEPIASSGESYHNKADCIHAINLVRSTDNSTPIIDLGSAAQPPYHSKLLDILKEQGGLPPRRSN